MTPIQTDETGSVINQRPAGMHGTPYDLCAPGSFSVVIEADHAAPVSARTVLDLYEQYKHREHVVDVINRQIRAAGKLVPSDYVRRVLVANRKIRGNRHEWLKRRREDITPKIRAMLLEGAGYVEIKAECECSFALIRSVRIEMEHEGIDTRKTKRPAASFDVLERMRAEGKTYEEIAQKLNVSVSSVWNRLNGKTHNDTCGRPRKGGAL